MVTMWINDVNYMLSLLSNAYGVTSSGVLYTYNNQSPSQKSAAQSFTSQGRC